MKKDDEYINIETTARNIMKKKQKDVMEQKHKHGNLNLKLSITIFLIVAVFALIIIINKGHIGGVDLVYVNDSLHTAELECENYYLSINENESTPVTLTIDGVEYTEGFTLNSSDDDIAKIEDGKVVAGSEAGSATITAYYEKYNLNISSEVVSYVPIDTLTTSVESSTISEGKEMQLNHSVEPSDATDDFLTYSSSDPSIATIDKDGMITGVSSGKVTITVVDELTGASTTRNITVK